MSDPYPLLTEATIPAYLRTRPDLARRIDPTTVDAREVGDGNLNLVFVCRDGGGRTLVLKQSIPYVRAAGPSWPLTADRSHAEARGLAESCRVSPTTSVDLFAYDPVDHVLAMEDLSRLRTWRAVLADGGPTIGVAESCGRHVARLLFGTGVLGRDASDVRVEMGRSANPDLCRITEDLVFTEPYVDHPNNRYDAEIEDAVASLRADPRVLAAVSRLKLEFMTRTDALIHGDLHTGSVMVDPEGCTAPKVIDAEFCCFGPVAFDLGTLVGNFLLATVGADGADGDAPPHRLATLTDELWDAFTDEFWRLWAGRVDRSLTDAAARARLDGIRRDVLGFAACEAIRRVIGFAKVTDLETLPRERRVQAARAVLDVAGRWLVDAEVVAPQTGAGDSSGSASAHTQHDASVS